MPADGILLYGFPAREPTTYQAQRSSGSAALKDYLKDRITALVLLAAAGAAWYFSGTIPGEARQFPRLILGAALVLSMLMLLRSFAPALRSSDVRSFFKNPRNFAVVLAAIVAYVVLLTRIGFFTASILFIPLISILIGQRRPAVLALSTAIFLLFVYLVFVVFFERPLPPEFWLRED